MNKVDIAWNLFLELRRELIESQKLRAQIIGFKITFVSAAIGLIGTNVEKFSSLLLVIPAFAAIFFDFLIVSYSFSIKRIGFYIRTEIEPFLKKSCELHDLPFWEEFLHRYETEQSLSLLGHLGLTIIAIGISVIVLLMPFRPVLSSVLVVVLAVLCSLDVWAFRTPNRFHWDELPVRSR